MSKRYQSRYKPLSIRRSERKSRNKFFITLIVLAVLFYLLIFWVLPTFVGGLSYLNKKPIGKVENIEDNLTLAPPVLSIPYEATNSASIKIDGYSLANSVVEIYLDDTAVTKIKTSDNGNFTSGFIDLNLGTNNLYGKTIDDQGKKSLASKTIKVIYDNERPKLEVLEPTDNKNIEGGAKSVKVSGKTNSNKQVTITVNGSRLIVNSDGNFSQDLELNEGDNNIQIMAQDQAGNSNSISRKVTYKAS